MASGPDWVRSLTDSDLSFMRNFVLTSGSLKAMATTYGVSYPTIRIKLDRLIAKIEIFDQAEDEFTGKIRQLALENDMPAELTQQILELHREGKNHD